MQTVLTNLRNETNEYLNNLRNTKPSVYSCVDQERVPKLVEYILSNNLDSTDFETNVKNSRGTSYIKAQESLLVREKGISNILQLISPNEDINSLNQNYKILDLLGGNGLIKKVADTILERNNTPTIVTSDISKGMIENAIENGLVALRQPAQYLMFKDNSMDGILLAYGTHHIPKSQRNETIKEARRVLKETGKLIVHDFEENGPVARWFNEVVDKYSLTGHDFPHFTFEEMNNYFEKNNFVNYNIKYMYDPFIFTGSSELEVIKKLSTYLINMYGLEKLKDVYSDNEVLDIVYIKAKNIYVYDYPSLGLPENFGESKILISQIKGKWYIEMPRLALVGTAIK
ncbi:MULTISPECIES: methyltransferase domain-containing protein [Bacillus cereus group]|uniref:methyltransferase domain-containing protein n=1 Tax=Bacillus cereus group TaxID=86661 RepID=UPI000EA06B98|nr:MULTISPECIES: methyltransferase domain-containing protein [Bacillus cereus group]MDF9530203.1 methyltransferase domain-containing protein [Bacillus cereus]MDG1578390.1 methyltransferase domain-containing protein [Bacillus cereus]RKI20809.1 methyltransferase domain-containing protein [Bacillus thuringiensis]